MHKLCATIALATTLAIAAPIGAQTGGVGVATAPGVGVVVGTVKATATITAIDKKTRDVTLKGPQGNEVVVTAGPQVVNFDSLKVGDKVDVEYTEAVTLELKKGGGLIVGRTTTTGTAGSKPGDTPAGMKGREVTIVADVVAVDPARQMITLKGPQRTVDVKIGDPEQFKRIAKGDQVEATYTQSVAMAVKPPAK